MYCAIVTNIIKLPPLKSIHSAPVYRGEIDRCAICDVLLEIDDINLRYRTVDGLGRVCLNCYLSDIEKRPIFECSGCHKDFCICKDEKCLAEHSSATLTESPHHYLCDECERKGVNE